MNISLRKIYAPAKGRRKGILTLTSTGKASGAIVVLSKGERNERSYATLIDRNKSLRKYVWSPSTDVIIFHEGNILENHQKFIQGMTSDMPITFVNISRVFTLYHLVNKSICPSTAQSRRFSPGYHSMCYFWFISFQEYLKEYDWLLRIDTDCEVKSESRHIIPPKDKNIYLSSTSWLDLENEKYDTISATKPDGDVVRGMKDLVNKYATRDGLSTRIETWKAPYSNVMYMDLNWVRTTKLLQEFISAVAESDCIFSNRWGDSPLWGAAVRLLNEPYHILPIAYYHGSHHVYVDQYGVLHDRGKKGSWKLWISSFFYN